jgi:hypothetical protein
MRLLTAIAILGLSVAAIGCCAIPKRGYVVSRHGVRAGLIHGKTEQTVDRTPVTVAVDGTRFERTTDRKGRVFVPAETTRRWQWFGWPRYDSRTQASIDIQCSGFNPQHIEWDKKADKKTRKERAGVIDLGYVTLEPR